MPVAGRHRPVVLTAAVRAVIPAVLVIAGATGAPYAEDKRSLPRLPNSAYHSLNVLS